MEPTDLERGEETARQQLDITSGDESGQRERRRDRRIGVAELFGGYQGPERRSGRERRAS